MYQHRDINFLDGVDKSTQQHVEVFVSETSTFYESDKTFDSQNNSNFTMSQLSSNYSKLINPELYFKNNKIEVPLEFKSIEPVKSKPEIKTFSVEKNHKNKKRLFKRKTIPQIKLTETNFWNPDTKNQETDNNLLIEQKEEQKKDIILDYKTDDNFNKVEEDNRTNDYFNIEENNSQEKVLAKKETNEVKPFEAKNAIRTKRNKIIEEYTKNNDNTYKSKSESKKSVEDGMFMNVLYVFEIYNWLKDTDIVVRLIIGAIGGILVFGTIFAKMSISP